MLHCKDASFPAVGNHHSNQTRPPVVEAGPPELRTLAVMAHRYGRSQCQNLADERVNDRIFEPFTDLAMHLFA